MYGERSGPARVGDVVGGCSWRVPEDVGAVAAAESADYGAVHAVDRQRARPELAVVVVQPQIVGRSPGAVPKDVGEAVTVEVADKWLVVPVDPDRVPLELASRPGQHELV